MKPINQKIKEAEEKLSHLKQLKEKIDAKQNTKKVEWIKISKLGNNIEVEAVPRKPMTYIEAEKLCVNGLRMLDILEAGFIWDNNLIDGFAKKREWIKHYSNRTRKLGYGCSVAGLDSGRLFGNYGLYVGGDWDDSYGGFAFGVRFCRDLKKSLSLRKKALGKK